MESMAIHVKAMLEMQKKEAVTFDYGNNIRQGAKDGVYVGILNFAGIFLGRRWKGSPLVCS